VNNSVEKSKQLQPTQLPSQPHYFKKRIGSTYYKVAVYHSDTSKENLEDKILRLAKNDAANIAKTSTLKRAAQSPPC
jgi:hypothetical protein